MQHRYIGQSLPGEGGMSTKARKQATACRIQGTEIPSTSLEYRVDRWVVLEMIKRGINSWKILFGIDFLCEGEHIEVFKSRNSLTVCDSRRLE